MSPTEYVRAKNCNTPQYWNTAHRRNRDVTPRSTKVAEIVADAIENLPPAFVTEYGFGAGHLARRLGPQDWEGIDFSEVAVQKMREAGFLARVQRCCDAKPPHRSTVVAIEVLEHLDHDEMIAFLDGVKEAPHAFFSVPQPTTRDLRFPQHMRGFGSLTDFTLFLSKWWPKVTVEKVGISWMLAHCERDE